MATYTSFSELKDKQLELGDEVQFTIKGEKLFYIVNRSFLVDSTHTSNAIIFEKLNISDKNKYAGLIYGYFVVSGKGEYSWPEFRENDYKAATRLVCNLFKKCEDVVKGSLYKKGDKVRVKDHYDPGCSENDYPFTFSGKMLNGYGGKEVTITGVFPSTTCFKQKLYTEGYKYYIAEDGGFFTWSAAMFSGKVNKTTLTEEEPYEVGDFVKITSVYDPVNYPRGLSKTMVDTYGGQWCRIKGFSSTGLNESWMLLESTDGISIPYSWTKEMFSEHRKVLIESPCKGDVLVDVSESSEFSFTIDDIPETCHYHPYVIDQAIEECSKIKKISLKEAFERITSSHTGVSNWFRWKATSQGLDYWCNINSDPSFIPEDYTPKYYKESKTTSHEVDMDDEPTISSSLDEKIIAKTNNKLVIPCSYQETTLSIKPVKVKF